MFRKKKGFTASQSKAMSRRMRSATIGTHVPQARPSSRRQRMNAADVGFANSRKKQRAARGLVDHVTPRTASGESASAYSRRVSQREFTASIQRQARIRRLVAIVAAVAVVAVVGIGTGTAAFFGSVSAKMALSDQGVLSALAAQPEGEPYYVLLAADLDSSDGSNGGLDAVVLARVDEAARACTLVSVPSNLRVRLSDGDNHPLSDAVGTGGDSALVSAVASFAGVDISHFVRTDATGLAHMVDTLGGVEVDVSEEVDDPTAGDVYLPAGTQTLGGKEALTFLRARNFTGGLQTQAQNRCSLAAALAGRLFASSGLSSATLLDSVAEDVQTDWSASDALAVAGALGGLEASSVQWGYVPGYEATTDNATVYVADDTAWQQVMDLMAAGQDPLAAEADDTSAVDPASFEITVRNGSGITGGAAQISDTLTAAGFKVKETGNADSYVYGETLVIYNDAAMAPAAEAVVKALGTGRTVASNGFYTFDTQVLVVLGSDWKPLN